MFWILAAFLLTNFYSAELTSSEISPAVVKSEERIEDLMAKGIQLRLAEFERNSDEMELIRAMCEVGSLEARKMKEGQGQVLLKEAQDIKKNPLK